MWREEDDDRGGRGPGGRGGQSMWRDFEAPEGRNEKGGQPQQSQVVPNDDDYRGVTEDCD